MAHPVQFQTTHGSTANDVDVERLRVRLERAREVHAKAMLEAYGLLQSLHDRGILDACRSALDAADEILDTGVSAAESPGTIRALRNLLFFYDVLGGIDPERLQGMAEAISDGLTAPQREDRLSLWKVIRRATSRDSLRGLMVCLAVLESIGRHLAAPARNS